MKVRLTFFFILSTQLMFAQVNKELTGSWVKKSVERYTPGDDRPIADHHSGYLRYEFPAKGKLKIYVSYLANGLQVDHKLKKRILSLGFAREFFIESVDENRLVLLETINGKPTAESVRYRFEREAFYIENLPVDPQTKIQNDQGEVVYVDSEKLHPKYSHKKYPDFHVYLNNQIRKAYPDGPNYLYVIYELKPDATIGNVAVLHHANEASTTLVKEVIRDYEGTWQLPKLDGEGVTVLMNVEDWYDKSNNGAVTISTSQGVQMAGYGIPYLKAYKKAARAYLLGDYPTVFEMLGYCEQMRPDEPNIPYLRYLSYLKLNEPEKAAEQKVLLKGTKLAFLVD